MYVRTVSPTGYRGNAVEGEGNAEQTARMCEVGFN